MRRERERERKKENQDNKLRKDMVNRRHETVWMKHA